MDWASESDIRDEFAASFDVFQRKNAGHLQVTEGHACGEHKSRKASDVARMLASRYSPIGDLVPPLNMDVHGRGLQL